MIRTYKYICPNCNKEFWNRDKGCICCSKSCSFSYYWKQHKAIVYSLNCTECKKEFKTTNKSRLKFQRNFCSSNCYTIYKEKSGIFKNKQRKGHKLTEEHKEKCRKASKGNKYRLGSKHTLEWRNKQSLRRRGNQCNFWKGGIHKFRGQYGYNFTIQLKEKIRVRDNFKCQICGVPELELNSRLSIHHIDYNKKNSNENNLVSLCKSCHNKTSIGDRIYYQKLLQRGESYSHQPV
jgi:hypothetical protein